MYCCRLHVGRCRTVSAPPCCPRSGIPSSLAHLLVLALVFPCFTWDAAPTAWRTPRRSWRCGSPRAWWTTSPCCAARWAGGRAGRVAVRVVVCVEVGHARCTCICSLLSPAASCACTAPPPAAAAAQQPGTSGIKGTPSALPNGLTAWESSPENSDGLPIRVAAISSEPLVTLRAYTHTPRISCVAFIALPYVSTDPYLVPLPCRPSHRSTSEFWPAGCEVPKRTPAWRHQDPNWHQDPNSGTSCHV